MTLTDDARVVDAHWACAADVLRPPLALGLPVADVAQLLLRVDAGDRPEETAGLRAQRHLRHAADTDDAARRTLDRHLGRRPQVAGAVAAVDIGSGALCGTARAPVVLHDIRTI